LIFCIDESRSSLLRPLKPKKDWHDRLRFALANASNIKSKTSEIYPLGIYYNSWKSSINTEFSNGVNTHVSNKSIGGIKNPFDDIFFNDG